MADKKDTLVYYPARIRAEAIRMLYAMAGKEFEDVRVFGEAWEATKPGKT